MAYGFQKYLLGASFCLLIFLLSSMQTLAAEAAAENLTDFSEAAKILPKPREIWPILKKEHVVPIEFTIKSDEIVTSDTDPTQKLRKVRAHFWSQKIGGKRWGHPCTILMPADNSRNMTPERKGKVVIFGGGSGEIMEQEIANYGEPIAARTGYPTMILANPGEYEDGSSIECDIQILGRLRKETGQGYYNMNCQLAVAYIQAMNAFQEFLGVDTVKAVLGGHSKRGRSAPVAAAMDDRVASAIIMGNEGVFLPSESNNPNVSFYYPFFQEQVHVPVFYLGVTNEGGYKMFNVSLMEKQLRCPLTVEMIPNYVHATYHPVQYMDFLMWVAHTFDGRPLSHISMTTERKDKRTVVRAKITGGAKVKNVMLWVAYSDNPQWRDVMWYHYLMWNKGDGNYEGNIHGKVPDAIMVEVSDIAQGISGYVSTTPLKMSDAPVVERDPTYGYLPRYWEPAK